MIDTPISAFIVPSTTAQSRATGQEVAAKKAPHQASTSEASTQADLTNIAACTRRSSCAREGHVRRAWREEEGRQGEHGALPQDGTGPGAAAWLARAHASELARARLVLSEVLVHA